MKLREACLVMKRFRMGKRVDRMYLEIITLWLEYHPYEILMNQDGMLTKKGESFLTEVYWPWKREAKYLGLKTREERSTLLDKKDEAWTRKNLDLIFDWSGKRWNMEEIFDGDVSCSVLCKAFGMPELSVFEEWIGAQRKKDGCAFEDGDEKYFASNFAKLIVKGRFKKYFLEARSRWVAKRWDEKWDIALDVDESLWNWKRKKNYIVKESKQRLWLIKDITEVSEITSVGELRRTIEMYHPCEIFVIKKDGDFYFTEKGYVWFFSQFMPNFELLGSNDYIKKEIEFTKGWMASKQLRKRNLITGTWHDVGSQYEMMGIDVWSMYHIVMQVDLNNHLFSMTDILKVENEFPMLELNALSKWIGPSDQKEFNINATIVNKNKSKKQNLTTSYWTEIHDLKADTYYSGRIMNRYYSYFDKKHREVLVINVMLDDKRQVKVRLPYRWMEKRCFLILLDPLCPFQFYVRKVDENHKRIEKFMPCEIKWYTVEWTEKFPYALFPHKKKEV